MKTDELIEMLSRGDVKVDRRRIVVQVLLALLAAFFVSGLILLFGFKVNPDLAMLLQNTWFWVRFAFIASVAAISWTLLTRLGTPGRAARAPVWAVTVPFALLAALAVVLLMMAPSDERADMLLGASWDVCARNISLVTLPLFVAIIWIARRYAPTRLRTTAAIAGLFAGALGAFVYSLHCGEVEPAFLIIWYSLGMLIPAAIGALFARWLLRW